MADVFTREKRSEVMSRIKGRGNRDTELAFLKLLRTNHITGWRRHLPLPGTPDFAFRKARLAVFIDGCFWHCCPRCSNKPANNAEFWSRKLAGNVARDKRVAAELRKRGWQVLRYWEHDLTSSDTVLRRLRTRLAKSRERPVREPPSP